MSVNKNRPSASNLNQLVMTIPVRRKLADQNDRDQFEWSQWQSATKAINNTEAPAKEKHIRNLAMGTLRLEGSRLFWSMVNRIQIESHPIVSWKLCYVIHRLLRDGHRHVVHDCIILTPYFDQLCKYWSGVEQGYGLLSYRYCQFLVSKLKFHVRYPTFAGDLTIDEHNDIRRLFGDKDNSYSQLCTELFSYIEELLNFVQAIFTSLDQSRTNSMTTTGQCRLNPLIACIQDSSLLYDHIVKVLFKLHEGSSDDALQNHRQKLAEQFRKLKRFYNQTSSLQFFRNLVKIPVLPENPPNFKIKDEVKSYQTPVPIVSVPAADLLQRMGDPFPNTTDATKSATDDDFVPNEAIFNRSREIIDLEQRIKQYDAMLKQNRSETDDLHRTIATKDVELLAEKNHRLQVEEQLRQRLDNQQRIEAIQAIDQKGNSNEKFNKLLDTYNKLNEEHAAIVRREGESKKQSADLNQQYTQLKEDYKRKEEEFNQNYEKLNNEIIQLRQTNDELQDRIRVLTTERDDYQSITKTTSERIKEVEHAKQNVEQRYKELANDKTRLDQDKSTFEQKLKQTEGARRDLFDKNREHEEDLIDLIHDREMLEQKVIDLEESTREWTQKYLDTTDKQKLMQANHEKLVNHMKRQHKHSILTYCINQMDDALERSKEVEVPDGAKTFEYLLLKLPMVVASAKKLVDLWKKLDQSDETATPSFLNECLTLSNYMVEIVTHGKVMPTTGQGVNLANNCRDLVRFCVDLYQTYQASSAASDVDKQTTELIHRLNALIENLKTSAKKNAPK